MYSCLDNPADASLLHALWEQAETQRDAVWIREVDGPTLTFAQAADDAARVAGLLQYHGVKPGERVGLMMHNGLDFVRAFFGIQASGAVAVLINTELRGDFLAHQLRNSAVRLVVTESAFAETIIEASQGTALQALICDRAHASALNVQSWSDWRDAEAVDRNAPDPGSVACIMYTSGTSGPAKGVLMPHAHLALYGIGAIGAFEVTDADRYYIVLPLFHANGLLMQLGTTLLAGIEAVLRDRFSASNWLSDIRSHGATLTHLLGALAAFVVDQPERPDDRDHRLRAVLNGPNVPEIETILRDRFGVDDVISGFGMTEVNIPIWGRVGRSTPGAAGWPRDDWFDVIIADPETDRELPRGQQGEILIRPRVPGAFMAGYLDIPDRTVEAWRNLWFHTGDAGRMEEDGLVTFVGRIKDNIRRRGENISASEVEASLSSLPGIAEVAAFAVPSDIVGGEDELMLAVVREPGRQVGEADLLRAADGRLPRFARPRFLRFDESLPKTATGKIQHAILRQRGAEGAYDRDAGDS
ncbi:MAG: AMP-binding protein [Pseudomonadota bacterium]